MRDNGLTITGARGDFHLENVQATDRPEEIGKVDFVLFTPKLWDVETTGQAIKPMIDSHTGVVTLQNGVDAPDRLAGVIGREAVIPGVAVINAVIEAPGRIQQMGEFQNLTFGEFDGVESGRVQALLASCEAAGIEARISPDIIKDLWQKFVFLVSASSLTAASRQRMGYIRTDPDARATLKRLLAEVAAVGRACGVGLAEDIDTTVLGMIDGQNPEAIASMTVDLLRGNRLELPWLAGKAAALGIEHNVETPALQALLGALNPYAMGPAELPKV
jgi:2-dehydropantoate 2-reductase